MTVRAELELDIRDALREIEDLGDTLAEALEKAVEPIGDMLVDSIEDAVDRMRPIEVPVDTDTLQQDLVSAIADAETILTPQAEPEDAVATITEAVDAIEVTVTPEADATGITDDITVAVEAADVTVTPTADAAGVVDEITTAVESATPEITPDFSGLATGITDAIEQALIGIDLAGLSDAVADAIGSGASEGFAGADTGGVDDFGESTEDLAQAANDANQSLNVAAGSATVLNLALDLASGSTGRLKGLLQRFGPAAGVFTALSAAVGGLFAAGQKSVAATEALNLVFGDSADAVQKIDIGGLTGDLGELAIESGSSGSALRQATVEAGRFGLSFGATKEQVLETTEQLQALALRAVALKPSLGDAGTALNGILKALRTGRPAALIPFGISLDQLQVKQLAAARAFKDGGRAVTAYDKVVVSAELVTKQLGDTIGTDFAKGTEQATVRLKRLRVELGAGLARAGKQFVEPLIGAAEQLVPVTEELADAVGRMVASLIPLIVTLAQGVAPAAVAAAQALGAIGEAAGPGLRNLIDTVTFTVTVIAGIPAALGVAAVAVGRVIAGISPTVEAFGRFFVSIGEAVVWVVDRLGPLGAALEKISPVFRALGDAGEIFKGGLLNSAVAAGVFAAAAVFTIGKIAGLVVTISNAITASKLLNVAFGVAAVQAGTFALSVQAALGWIGLAAAAIGFVVTALDLFGRSTEKSETELRELADALLKVTTEATATSQAVIDLGQNFAETLEAEKLGDFGKTLTANSGEVLSALQAVGVGTDDLGRQLVGGREGLETFARSAVASLGPDGVGQITEGLKKVDTSFGEFIDAAAEGGDTFDSLKREVDAAFTTAGPINDQTRAILEQFDSVGKLVDQFHEQQRAEEEGALSALRLMRSNGELTDSEAKLIDTGKDHATQLAAVNKRLDETAKKEEEVAAVVKKEQQAVRDADQDWLKFTDAVLRGKIGLQDLDRLALKPGAASLEEMKRRLGEARQSAEQLSAGFANTLPKAITAFSDFAKGILDAQRNFEDVASSADSTAKEVREAQRALEEATDPQRILDNLNKLAESGANYEKNIRKLYKQGNVAALQVIATLPQEEAQVLAQALANADPKTQAAINRRYEETARGLNRIQKFFNTKVRDDVQAGTFTIARGALDTYGLIARGIPKETAGILSQTVKEFGLFGPEFEAAAGLLGLNSIEKFQNAFPIPEKTKAAFVGALQEIRAAHPEMSEQAARIAAAITVLYGKDLKPGPETKKAFDVAKTVLQRVGEDAKSAAEGAGRTIGDSFGSGMALGITTSEPEIKTAAEKAVQAAYDSGLTRAGAGSPSKLFAELGGFLSAGLAVGITEGEGGIRDASRQAVREAALAADDEISQAVRERESRTRRRGRAEADEVRRRPVFEDTPIDSNRPPPAAAPANPTPAERLILQQLFAQFLRDSAEAAREEQAATAAAFAQFLHDSAAAIRFAAAAAHADQLDILRRFIAATDIQNKNDALNFLWVGAGRLVERFKQLDRQLGESFGKSITKQTGRSERGAEKVLADTVGLAVEKLGESVTHLGARQRFLLTTGQIGPGDLVQPVADRIERVIARGDRGLAAVFHDLDRTLRRRLDFEVRRNIVALRQGRPRENVTNINVRVDARGGDVAGVERAARAGVSAALQRRRINAQVRAG